MESKLSERIALSLPREAMRKLELVEHNRSQFVAEVLASLPDTWVEYYNEDKAEFRRALFELWREGA